MLHWLWSRYGTGAARTSSSRSWLLAYVWWLLWGFGRWLWLADGPEHWTWYWRSSRRTSWWPLRCAACGWRGPERWTVHSYKGDGMGDVTPVSECPACNAEVW